MGTPTRVGVDSGGTFTDAVAVDGEGRLAFAKVPSDAGDPAAAVLAAIAAVGGAGEVVHGTTVATNALLTRGGGPTALVATEGFEDLLVLRRQARPKLYALEPVTVEPLVPDELRFGLAERVGARGQVIVELDPARLDELAEKIAASGAKSIAVALLHSYADAKHEKIAGERLLKLGLPIALSSEVLPEHREFERTSTTVADAYVMPVVGEYLARLEGSGGPSWKVMQSSGGASSVGEARRHPVRTLLSGPAAGVIGARAVAARAGVKRLITFDMGGTSTDVASIDGDPELTSDGEVAGQPIALPSLPVHSVGAGGGSIARVDEGGALKVGPASAGSQPGPACYGRGGALPTLTDAALLDGRLAADHFLDGKMALDREAATRAIAPIAFALGVDPAAAARGIIEVAVAVAARAVKKISVERGRDPRDFVLVAFGGAGGMFGCDVAAELGIEKVLVPPAPGLLCAYGALVADVVRERAATRVVLAGETLYPSALAGELAPLEAAADGDLDAEGIPHEQRRLTRKIDLRYAGQSYEISLEIPALPGDLVAAFHEAHRRRFGFAMPERPVERVALRVIARGITPPPPALTVGREEGEALIGERTWARARLAPGGIVDGPALIVELSATTFVVEGWRATVDEDGALHLARR
jgi:N-methylhydantoinase A